MSTVREITSCIASGDLGLMRDALEGVKREEAELQKLFDQVAAAEKRGQHMADCSPLRNERTSLADDRKRLEAAIQNAQ